MDNVNVISKMFAFYGLRDEARKALYCEEFENIPTKVLALAISIAKRKYDFLPTARQIYTELEALKAKLGGKTILSLEEAVAEMESAVRNYSPYGANKELLSSIELLTAVRSVGGLGELSRLDSWEVRKRLNEAGKFYVALVAKKQDEERVRNAIQGKSGFETLELDEGVKSICE